MKFTLKDYQEDAVEEVLERFETAAKRWHQDSDIHSFSLTAVTGAGKTVMAAAVFETLFYGNDNFNFKADPSAVVIWLSDNPSLNSQSCFKLMEASDQLKSTDLIILENAFDRKKFEAGKVYFLNTQKLSKKSLLTREYKPEERPKVSQGGFFNEPSSDLRLYTIWQTIKNTIEDPNLTLYFVLDEAHRGMGKVTDKQKRDKTTIIKKLISGFELTPPMPIVLGISATVERFNDAMKGIDDRNTLKPVKVDPERVQESGLLKDTISLDNPIRAGKFDNMLLADAVDRIKESSAAWKEYSQQQDDVDTVKPLLVLQVPNTPKNEDMIRALDTIFEKWPDLTSGSIAHVFGEHKDLSFGGYVIPYKAPEKVQESTWIQVLIAKEAISTGWDCPRAEVLISFRPAEDHTHITQLIGRMIRTPLARRIPGDECLNSVSCFLPFFDSKTVERVVQELTKSDKGNNKGEQKGTRVLINPKKMTPNPAVPESLWKKFTSLPTQSLPRRRANPVKRLTKLAHELASDGLLKDAGKKAHAEMHKTLVAAQARNSEAVAKAREAILKVEMNNLTHSLRLKDSPSRHRHFVKDADRFAIGDAYRHARGIFSPDLVRSFTDYLADKNNGDVSREEALLEAQADIAALSLVSEVRVYLEDEAKKLTKSWFKKYRVPTMGLSDQRQEEYRLTKGMSSAPEDLDLAMPKSRMECTYSREKDGEEKIVQTYEKHLLCNDEDALFPADLNSWEDAVIKSESIHKDFLFWYRNPSRYSQESLAVAYTIDKKVKLLRPDFLFFSTLSDGSIAVDIIDPHGHHYADALPKLKGLAKYAEKHSEIYRRVEAVAEVEDRLRYLDLTDSDVRNAIAEAETAKSLYEGTFGQDY